MPQTPVTGPHGIDIYAPGGVQQLMDFHRKTFGDATMETEGGAEGGQQQAGAGDQGNGGGEGGQQQQNQDTSQSTQQQAAEWDGKIESLPADVQKIIKDLRTENGDKRAKTSATEKQLSAIAKVLNPDAKDGDKPDAGQLAKDLAERDTAAKQAQTELAVYKTASRLGADADALLDSRAFLAKIADLDPSKTADIEKAIKDAVKENPKLKVAQAASKSGAEFNGGSGETRNSNVKPGQSRIAASFNAT